MALLPNLAAYPKMLLLQDGTKVQIRTLEPADKLALLRFFTRLPEVERYYLRHDVTAPDLIESWIANMDLQLVVPLVALVDEEIVADASLHRSEARSRSHVGELRLVVAPEMRHRELGRRLIRELLEIASDLDLHKVVFELATKSQQPAIATAKAMGFKELAIGSEWIRDIGDSYEDLAILEMSLDDFRRTENY